MNFPYKNTTIKIAAHVYEPSEDSFLLAEAALTQIKGTEQILEVGCGSGIISKVIKENTKARVTGVDINPYAVKCTKESGVEAIRGDLLSCLKGKFDMIIFNPPYLPTRKEERIKDWLGVALDGGYDGRRIIYRFLEDCNAHLADNGRILMVLSSLTGIEEVKSRMGSLGYAVEDTMEERFIFEQLKVITARKKYL
ncbi:putative S-adenosylmethionine-dependent methyltransferase [uncultured archaeon]|nr:putative S-adenosylmethionine-dependent methyltransferase [uncultured archaeon]